MSILCSVLLGLLAAVFAAQQPERASNTSLAGVVVNVANGNALSKATLQLTAWDDAAVLRAFTTDSDGKFVFDGLSPGRYRIAASRSGYVPTEYGQRQASSLGTPIELGAGQRLGDLRIEMVETGAIAGRVTGRNGEPIRYAEVEAVSGAYYNGRREMTPVQRMVTNDLGEYRLFWLPPGRYYVRANLPNAPYSSGTLAVPGSIVRSIPVSVVPSNPNSSSQGISAPTYYPSTANAQAAATVDLRSGETVGRVDIVAEKARPLQIRGVVIDGGTQRPAQGVSVMVAPRFPVSTVTILQRDADPNTGAFSFSALPPGPYMLAATYGTGTFGRTPVELGTADLADVRVVIPPAVNISGRIVIEGKPGADRSLDVSGLTIVAEMATPIPGGYGRIQTTPLADGSFTLQNAGLGEYRVYIQPLLNVPASSIADGAAFASIQRTVRIAGSGLAAGASSLSAFQNAYVKAIRFGTSDILNRGLLLDRAPTLPLEIVIGLNGGIVEGTVVDERTALAANVTVVIVPDASRRARSDLYRSTATDNSGRFQLRGVAPGQYKVFAWTDVEKGAWQDPEFLRAYEDRGTGINVDVGSTSAVETTVIP